MSEDFTRVVIDTLSLDQYLRPPNWIVSYSSESSESSIRMLLISPFEANELMPLFNQIGLPTQLRLFAARINDTQETLLHNMELSIPPINPLPYCDLLDSQLLVFSGSMYFADRREQLAYCHFLGLLPRQRTAEQQAAFDRGELHGSFVPTTLRATIAPPVAALCHFAHNPTEFAKKMVETRFDRLPSSSHVSAILLKSAFPI